MLLLLPLNGRQEGGVLDIDLAGGDLLTLTVAIRIILDVDLQTHRDREVKAGKQGKSWLAREYHIAKC